MTLAWIAWAGWLVFFGGADEVPEPGVVVFVCEHGAAKSVVAAAHFNRLAREAGLSFRALSRGTDPDSAVPPGVREGLLADGTPVDPDFVPSPVVASDLASVAHSVAHVVTFDVALPPGLPVASVTSWSGVPAVSDGYAAARREIGSRIEALLRELGAPSRK